VEFVAIDFETADYDPSSAISVGLVRFRGYEPAGEFYSLIRPPRLYVRPDFTEIHGLAAGDVRGAPSFARVWEGGMREFIGDSPLAAHNAPFDMRVLRAALARYGLPIPGLRYFCSLALARRAYPGLRSHALAALGAELGVSYDAHHALADAGACGRVVSLCAAALGAGGGEAPPALPEALRRAGLEMRRLNGR